VSTVYVSKCHGIADSISFLLWKYRVEISTRKSANLTGFLWSPNEDAGIVIQIRLRPLPSLSNPIHLRQSSCLCVTHPVVLICRE